MRSIHFRAGIMTLIFATLGCILILQGREAKASPYYQGKTITIVRGGMPGGSGEMQVRTILPYLKKYIPGDPSFILMHFPGSAGRRAANHVFSKARPDGMTIGSVGGGLVIGPILGLPGVRYDLDKLIFLGSTESGSPYAFYTRKELGLDSIEKLRAASGLRIGAQAVAHPIYNAGRIFAYLLGLKGTRYVTGYSGRELDLALLRGEVDAKGGSAATILQRNPDWLNKGIMNFHATIDIPKGSRHPRYTHLPALQTFAKTDRERKILALFRAFLYPRWPYFLPPGTPKEPVRILREALRKTFKDQKFFKTFKKLMRRDASPLTADKLIKAIKELPRGPEDIKLFKKFAGPGPLPPR